VSRSLKDVIENNLTEILGIPAATIYERQRRLVAGGSLESAEQMRGPGGGVRATPLAVATLLISLLATDSLTDTHKRTSTFFNLKNSNGEKFGYALATILDDDAIDENIAGVRVQRDRDQAILLVGASATFFGKPGRDWKEPPRELGLFVDVSIYRKSLQAIADILKG
jgi:hypothetical protein